jgi:hypothetical protein
MQQINTLAEWPAPLDEQRPMLGASSVPPSAVRTAARPDSAPLPVTQGLPRAVVPAAEALAKFLRKK